MSKGLFYIFYLFCFLPYYETTAGEISIVGIYLGDNLEIHNPISNDGKNFCIQKVYVNESLIATDPKNNIYQIDLSWIELDTPINIKIDHRDDAIPQILNPDAIIPANSFDFTELEIYEDSIIWKVGGLMYKPIFFIEKRINSSWKIIFSIEGNPENPYGRYSTDSRHNFGDNQYRIKCIMESGKIYNSGVVNFSSAKQPVSFYPSRVNNKITMSREAYYEVLDIEGKILESGREKDILLAYLDPGLYYLIIDGRKEKFIKK